MNVGNEVDPVISQTHQKLWNATRAGAWKLLTEAPKAWSGSDGHLYRDEKRIILKHLESVCIGAFGTLFLFATFRVSGSRWWTNTRKEMFPSYFRDVSKTIPVQEVHPPKQAKTHSTKEWRSYLDRKAEEETPFFKSISESHVLKGVNAITSSSVFTDFIISLFCGCSFVALFLRNKEEFRNDFANVPLFPGKSLIHTYVCPDVEKVFMEIDKKIIDANEHDDTLRKFDHFVRNCRTRSAFIASQRHLGVHTNSIVPYPGLVQTRSC